MGTMARPHSGLGGMGLVVGGVVVLLLAGMATTPRPETMADLPDAVVAQEAEDTTTATNAQIAALDVELTTPFDGAGVMGAALSLPVGVGKEGAVELNPRHYGKHNAGTLPADTILAYVRLCMEESHRGGQDPRDPQGRKLRLTIYYSPTERGFMGIVQVIGTDLCGGVIYSPFGGEFATRTVFGGSECFVPSCTYWTQKRVQGYYRQVIFSIGG